MNIADGMLQEFTYENASTRKMLERIPQAQMGWKPHAKSMTLARLASHIVEIPTYGASIFTQDEMVLNAGSFKPTEYATVAELLAAFDKNIAEAAKVMQGVPNDHMMKPWRFKMDGKLVFEMPRVVVVRIMMLSHTIHHRGQLSVYLRLQNVPLPPVYGPTADESPFPG